MSENHDVFDARIQLPASIIVHGPSQSGKTEFVMDLILNMNNMVNPVPKYIVWFYGTDTEIIEQLKKKSSVNIHFVQGLPDKGFESFYHNKKHTLFVVDDLLQEAIQDRNITNLFCREGHHNNVSVVLIMQDLFCSGTQRKTILRNAHYLCLFKNPLDMAGIYIIGQRIMPKHIREFLAIFEKATSSKHGYLFIDGKQSTPSNARLRTNIFGAYQKNFTILKGDNGKESDA